MAILNPAFTYGYGILGTNKPVPPPSSPFIETTEDKATKTIEEISYTASTKDLWDELHNEINPLSCMLHLQPDSQPIVIRFLGPFVKVQRFYHTFGLYTDISSFLDILGIANKNLEAIATAEKVFKNYLVKHSSGICEYSPSNINVALKRLDSIRKGEQSTWQNCVMANVFLRAGYQHGVEKRLRILPITHSLGTSILDFSKVLFGSKTNPTKISGISAHDISISKHGKKLGAQFIIKMSEKPLPLNKDLFL